MCQRLYRPGYSIPELSTPPRRRSTAAAMRDSSAGSNGSATRVIVTPPAVACVLLLSVVVSTVGPLLILGPVTGGRYDKRPPFPGGRFRHGWGHRLLAAPPLEVTDSSHRA